MENTDRLRLTQLSLQGFKSLDHEGQTIDLGDVTVMLGANGSGKSNLISFFEMLGNLTNGFLQNYVGKHGAAKAFLHYGPAQTQKLKTSLVFEGAAGTNVYGFTLSYAAGDVLIFTEEIFSFQGKGYDSPLETRLELGAKESGLRHWAFEEQHKIARYVWGLLKSVKVYQFHDTSFSARIRSQGYINDNRLLRSDGSNLAAFLYQMKNTEDGEKYYLRITRHIRSIMPQFGDFELRPSALDENNILLNWYEKDADYLFGPHQISDGSLRFMALTTLLMQPPESLPSVIVLDEPELGLHPSAIAILAGMIRMASQYAQIIIATQSPQMADEFDTQDILIVERDPIRKASVFKRLDENALSEWLEDYSLSELWEKNVIGGQP